MLTQRLGSAPTSLCSMISLATLLLATSLVAAAKAPGGPESEAGTAQSRTAAGYSCSAGTVTANVVALDQPYMLNRLGAAMPQGMMFALQSDVVRKSDLQSCSKVTCQKGQVQLRPDKRPRPIVLRVNQGQCLKINFNNLLADARPSVFQPVTRAASVHVNGMELASTIAQDGSFVGKNASSLVAPGASQSYTLYATAEGTFLLYSLGSSFGNGSEAGQITAGLFGAVNVEPPKAEYYRSQITRADLLLATTGFTPDGHPILDYNKVYPAGNPRAGMPILRMVDASGNTIYTDLNAIITGPNAGRFPDRQPGPEFNPIPASPDRREPFREFTIHYHEVTSAIQAFAEFYPLPDGTPGLSYTLAPGKDNFAINYGSASIGTEVLANRFHVGPEWDCPDCKFEEFFLASWAVGDPAMVTNTLANFFPKEPPVTVPNGVPPAVVQQMEQYAAFQQGLIKSAPPLPPPPQPGPKATQVFFPDDPSNVYHSYLRDHVKFRILHAGSNLTHVHHQHAHQWMHTPNDPNSSYLDSQLLSPGAAYTLEIDYNGGGNRNQTLGDSIFHCHFYPHFAAGMWSLWRVHDVFEAGTPLNNGLVVKATRALPDGEIADGTPIPALVPVPTLAMAPIPAQVQIVPVVDPNNPNKIAGYEAKTIPKCDRLDGSTQGTCTNPGYPFFIPGISGHRAPAPPLDFAPALTASGQPILDPKGQPEFLDGGLDRHVIVTATVQGERHNAWDFSKNNDKITARQLPEDGTPVEKAAMAFNHVRKHPSFTSGGQPADFITNGLPRGPQPGAPFADPAVDDQGNPVGQIRRYKAADIQTDVVFNKAGWHYPQQRFLTLWNDVKTTIAGQRAPEPLFFRANSKQDIVEYWQTNLVPSYYELDDFQVQTPTDIIGQHIHLVKFDVLASDGASNGFNYEDGTLSPQEVVDRINAIRAQNRCMPNDPRNGTFTCPVAKDPTPANGYPIDFGPPPPGQSYTGAQTTIQRWYADPLDGCFWPPCPNNGAGSDRTLRTVFTHDHFGPSTHQQAGLYAGLVVEPEKSQWQNPETGAPLGGGPDGGPTSWQANIITGANGADSYREFLLEFQDLALVYGNHSRGTAGPYPQYPPQTIQKGQQPWGWMDCDNTSGATTAINSPTSVLSSPPVPCAPTLISGSPAEGTMNVNYRSEPVPLRVDPTCTNSDPSKCDPKASDLSYAFSSQVLRNEAILNQQPVFPQNIDTGSPAANTFQYPPPLLSCANCVKGGDPYTPLMRAFQNDRVQVRVLVGAYLFNHTFGMEGLKWLFEPSSSTSGYRDNQEMGISEHFEMQFTVPSTKVSTADYLYVLGSGVTDMGQGLWGLFRTYNAGGYPNTVPDLKPLPNNPGGGVVLKGSGSCPANATRRIAYNVAAVYVGSGLSYNSRDGANSISNANGAVVYMMADANGKPLGSLPPTDPLVLRANAGDCMTVTLFNNIIPAQSGSLFTTADTNAPGVAPFAGISLFPSTAVGMHAQLVGYDVSQNNGVNVGLNPDQVVPACTAAPCPSRQYQWYAGQVVTNPDGTTTGVPIELGSANLITSDPIEQQPLSMIGALVVEPMGAKWSAKAGTSADITDASGNFLFREFVTILQNNVYLTQGVFNSINFGTEPMAYRFSNAQGKSPGNFDNVPIANAFSNSMPNKAVSPVAPQGEPQTPIFCALAGKPVRFRMLHPDGLGGFPDDVFTINGHVWQEEPYVTVGNVSSASLGNNPNSEWFGARDGFGPQNHFDILLSRAGGKDGVAGDYLYKSFPVGEFTAGNWGIFRVNATQAQQTACVAAAAQKATGVGPKLFNLPGAEAPAPPVVDPQDRFKIKRGSSPSPKSKE